MLALMLVLITIVSPTDICEDVELKQRIIEMKDEIESHRATRTRDLVRKRSQNTRRWVPGTGGGLR